ncbi:MAG: hypothetical protein IJW51_04765 [Clostridia bacterium]|nr:hypothetical protein [Clostridia bacterium]
MKIPLVFVVGFAVLLVLSASAARLAQSPLLDGLDPLMYHHVMHASNLATYERFADLNTAMTLGDFRSAIDICTEGLQDPKRRRFAVQYQVALAFCYFIMGEESKLCEATRALYHLFENPKLAKKKPTFSPWLDYYNDYLNRDFAKCRQIGEKVQALPAKSRFRITEMEVSLYTGIACYYSGDLDEARTALSHVAQNAPKLYISQVARDYLRAIEQGTPYDPRTATPSLMVLPYSADKPISRKKQRFSLIVLACAFALLILSIALITQGNRGTVEEVLTLDGDVTKLHATVPVSEDGDLLAIYTVDDSFYYWDTDENGSEKGYEPYFPVRVAYLDAARNGEYEFGISVDVFDGVYNTEQATYELVTAKSDQRVTFTVLTDVSDLPAGSNVTAFSMDGRTLYLYIISIEEDPTLFFDGYEIYAEDFD